jgi:hypothetical protein
MSPPPTGPPRGASWWATRTTAWVRHLRERATAAVAPLRWAQWARDERVEPTRRAVERGAARAIVPGAWQETAAGLHAHTHVHARTGEGEGEGEGEGGSWHDVGDALAEARVAPAHAPEGAADGDFEDVGSAADAVAPSPDGVVAGRGDAVARAECARLDRLADARKGAEAAASSALTASRRGGGAKSEDAALELAPVPACLLASHNGDVAAARAALDSARRVAWTGAWARALWSRGMQARREKALSDAGTGPIQGALPPLPPGLAHVQPADLFPGLNLGPPFYRPCRHLYHHGESCSVAHARDFGACLGRAARLYLPIHVVPLALFRWRAVLHDPVGTAHRTYRAVARSSMFLATYVWVIKSVLCVLREARGEDAWWHPVAAGVCTCVAVGWESPTRVHELLLYTATRSLEVLWDLGERRGAVARVRGGSVLLFMAALAGLLALPRSDLKPAYRSLLTFLFGAQA